MTARTPDAQPHERGFILVGVVTFMFALTILGLSLFALSSYEAQFFHAAATREQSLQNCESGMEVVKALLNSGQPHLLENAQLAVGQFGVTSALAYQSRGPLPSDTVSRGPVDWDSVVVIVVRAKSGAVERTLEARFAPTTAGNPYQRLITAGRGIQYLSNNSDDAETFRMSGRVWQYVQSPSDTAWTEQVNWTSGRPVDPTTTPQVLADAFVDAALAVSQPVAPYANYYDEGDYYLRFVNPIPGPGAMFFKSPEKHAEDRAPEPELYDAYEYFSYRPMTITVKGTVVWVVDQGVCFQRRVIVRPDDSGTHTLIIVAKANGRHRGYENRGIWFQGGLETQYANETRVRVYLVSQGDIGVTHHHSSTYYDETYRDAYRMSIVAGGAVQLGGPNSEERFRLSYTSASEDAPAADARADLLLSAGALPPVAGGSGAAYTIARSGWLETTPR